VTDWLTYVASQQGAKLFASSWVLGDSSARAWLTWPSLAALSNPLIETLTRHFPKIISSTRYDQPFHRNTIPSHPRTSSLAREVKSSRSSQSSSKCSGWYSACC